MLDLAPILLHPGIRLTHSSPVPIKTAMYLLFANRRSESAEQRAQHARYLAARMAPMIRALLLMAVVLYLFATITRTILGIAPLATVLPTVPTCAVPIAGRSAWLRKMQA